MEKPTLADGKIIKWKAQENQNCRTGKFILANIRMINNTDEENLFGQMVKFITANGLKANKKGLL